MRIVNNNKLFEDYFDDIDIEDKDLDVNDNDDDVYVSDVNDWITFQFDVETNYMTTDTMFSSSNNFESRFVSFLDMFEKRLIYILNAVDIVDGIHFKYTLHQGNIYETDVFRTDVCFNRTVLVKKMDSLQNYIFTISCYVRQGDIKTNKRKFIMLVNSMKTFDCFVRGKFAINMIEFVSVYMEYVKPDTTWYELAHKTYKSRLSLKHAQSIYGNATAIRLKIINAAKDLNCDMTYSDILRMTTKENNDYERLSEYLDRVNPMKMFYCGHFDKLDFSKFTIDDAFCEADFLQCTTKTYTPSLSMYTLNDNSVVSDVILNRSGRMYIIDRPLLVDASRKKDIGKYRVMVIFDGTLRYSKGDEYILTLMSKPIELSDDYEKTFSEDYINEMCNKDVWGLFQFALIAGHHSIEDAKKKMDKFAKLYKI